MKAKKLILLLVILGGAFGSCDKTCEEQSPNTNCICTMDYTPVCGCNGVTYGNACAADCKGITSYTVGECN